MTTRAPPASGKSLYAVSTLLQKQMKETVRHEDGTEYSRRLVVDNIPDLLLPHDAMAARARPVSADDLAKGATTVPVGDGLWNWFDWCKPGDIIVSDEVQRHWRPRGTGTKVPQEIAELETHRHKGVDLVLITQNAMLLDQNVRRLVGRHLHVRRLFGTARALVYDWDGCQTDTTRTQGATRSIFSYPKSAYKLYKSSELHTKQHQKIPLFLAFPVVVVALAVFAGPKAYDAMHRTMSGKSLQSAAAPSQNKPVALAASVPASGASAASAAPASRPVSSVVTQEEDKPDGPVGCVVLAGRCDCFDGDGARVPDVDHDQCGRSRSACAFWARQGKSFDRATYQLKGRNGL